MKQLAARKEEQAKQLKLEEARKEEEEALANQVVNEEELIDNNGEYIIFAGQSQADKEHPDDPQAQLQAL